MCCHSVGGFIYLEKTFWVKRENHKRCDTMGFREDGTSKLETRFRLLIVKFFLRRTFQSIVLHLVLSCVIKTCSLH